MFDRKALNEINRQKNFNAFDTEGIKKAPFMVFGQKKRKIKTSQKRRNYESQMLNN